jgi:site-specific DNA-cytosine methylase
MKRKKDPSSSPSLLWVKPPPIKAPPARALARTQVTLEALLSGRTHFSPPEHVDVVDLFCGCGGFSEGAKRVGHNVVLAVDNDEVALAVHRVNHPHATHQTMSLPDDSLYALLPEQGRRWHLHGSPPCTKLSGAGGTNRCEYDRDTGMGLVVWYLDLVLYCGCTTWSMEQVAQEDVLAELQRRQAQQPEVFDFEVVNMSHWGVPQDRKRVIAGTPHLISRLRDRAEPMLIRRIIDVLPNPPANAVGIKGRRHTLGREACKQWAKAFNKPENVIPKHLRMKRGGLKKPAPTVISATSLRWADAEGETIACLTLPETAVLQTFGDDYSLPCAYDKAILLLGNAIPPLFVERLMMGYRTPLRSAPISSLSSSPTIGADAQGASADHASTRRRGAA